MGNRCCGNVPDEACGWPKGTVRAIFSLIIVVCTYILAGYDVTTLILRDKVPEAMGILTATLSIISAVIGYYFGQKSGEAATKTIIESNEKLLAAKDREINNIRELRVGRQPEHIVVDL